MPKAQPFEVAVLVDTSTSWGAGIVRGAAEFAQAAGGWVFDVLPSGKLDSLALPPNWAGDGVIARVIDPQLADDAAQRGIPIVNVSFQLADHPHVVHCTGDQEAIGRLGAEHLLDRGFEHFAYCRNAFRREGYRDRICESYFATLESAGTLVHKIATPYLRGGLASWKKQLGQIAQQIERLRKPVGILAWDDFSARRVTEACRVAGINVPEEVAVLGVDNDQVMALISNPPLSSVQMPNEKIGLEAARILDSLMRGGPQPAEPLLIEPLGIVTRESTDTFAVDEPEVVAALRLIRAKFSTGLTVVQLVDELCVSRRALETRFKEVLGRGPSAELRRVRIAKAKQLLASTGESLGTIAKACGFGSYDVMLRNFQREVGVSPREFRSKARSD